MCPVMLSSGAYMNSKKERKGERERKIERVTEKDRELQSIFLDPPL